MKSKLGQYKGRLSPRQIADGMTAAIQNAARLLEDAILMLENERYPRAVSLAILSIEESGKPSILRSLAVENDEMELKKLWKDYRSHTSKNAMWIVPDLIKKGAINLEDFRHAVSKDSDHPYILENLKQIAFYTDCIGDSHWSIPEEVIDKETAESIVNTAKVLSKNRNYTEEEVRLWIKHLGPVWRKTQKEMNSGLTKWYDEMKDKGLVEEGNISFKDFVSGSG